MANTYVTTADVVNFNLATDKSVVEAVLENSPLLAALYAKPTEGNFYKYMRKTGLPAGGFRDGNSGLANKPASYELVTLDLGIYDASFDLDKAIAMQYKGGEAQILAQLGLDSMKAGNFGIEQKLIYGVSSGSEKFDGLKASATLVVDATGTTTNTASSAYVIVSGPLDTAVVWGNGAVIDISGQVETRCTDDSGNPFTAIRTTILGNVALQVGSQFSVVRIANITEDNGKGMTDKLISTALSKLPTGTKATMVAMSRRSLAQLQQSRTSFNPTGAPAEIPVDAFGTKIVACESIEDTDAIETFAS
jgi:hypothetical protein